MLHTVGSDTQCYTRRDRQKKQKSHSPTQNQAWDKEAAIALLNAHPPEQKINWSAAARTVGIQNGNAGQSIC